MATDQRIEAEFKWNLRLLFQNKFPKGIPKQVVEYIIPPAYKKFFKHCPEPWEVIPEIKTWDEVIKLLFTADEITKGKAAKDYKIINGITDEQMMVIVENGGEYKQMMNTLHKSGQFQSKIIKPRHSLPEKTIPEQKYKQVTNKNGFGAFKKSCIQTEIVPTNENFPIFKPDRNRRLPSSQNSSKLKSDSLDMVVYRETSSTFPRLGNVPTASEKQGPVRQSKSIHEKRRQSSSSNGEGHRSHKHRNFGNHYCQERDIVPRSPLSKQDLEQRGNQMLRRIDQCTNTSPVAGFANRL